MVKPSSFTLEHMPASLSQFGDLSIPSAPKEFSVWVSKSLSQLHLTTKIRWACRHSNAWFSSTCYHAPPPGMTPGICLFFVSWRSSPHPRARRKRQVPTARDSLVTHCTHTQKGEATQLFVYKIKI